MDTLKLLWTGFIIITYLGLNTTLNMFNKWALGFYGFQFPIFMTICHMGFGFTMLAPLMLTKKYWELHAPTLKLQWKGFVGIGLFLAANISLNNISLVMIDLSLNQVIRSAIPVVTCFLAVFVENRIPCRREVASLVVLCAGVMIGIWQGAVKGSPVGVAFAVIAMVCNALMMTYSGKILSQKVDALRLAFYTAPVCCLALLPFFISRELEAFLPYWQAHNLEVLAILLFGSCVALVYNVVHSVVIQLTSAVTTTVLGMVKILFIFLLSSLFLQEGRNFTGKMLVGVILTVIGFGFYSRVRLEAFLAKASAPSLPIVKNPVEEKLLSSSSPKSVDDPKSLKA